MAKKLADVVDGIAEKAVTGYKAIETAAVNGYKAVETGAVNGFKKVSDKSIEILFAKEGESLEEAKARLQNGIPCK